MKLHDESDFDQLAVQALRSIARDTKLKSYIQQSPSWYSILWSAAQRFVISEARDEALEAAKILASYGYHITLECIGENTSTEEECIKANNEFLDLINDISPDISDPAISLDLSHIGLNVTSELAVKHLRMLAETAKRQGVSIMINMEESSKITSILRVYREIAPDYHNVGITVQAHLHRTLDDVQQLLNFPGKVRVTKGAYQEISSVKLNSTEEIKTRYLDLIQVLAETGHQVAIATHDQDILQEVFNRKCLRQNHVEVEMLYGVCPDLLKHIKGDKMKTRIYLPYGKEWYLYLCHRLAEYPPNIYRALAECIHPSPEKSPYRSMYC